MSAPHLQRLGLGEDADERAIRRAYARELKLIDQQADPAAFQTLREAYEAALSWLQWRRDDRLSAALDAEVPLAELPQPLPHAEVPQSGAPLTKLPQAEVPLAETPIADVPAAPAAPSQPAATPAPPHHPEPPSEVADAAAAYAAFLHQIEAAAISGTPDTTSSWQARLEQSLDQLVSIEARELFEHHIASQLADGWRRGHEMLLVAAAATFGWQEDRRRLHNLGMAGAELDQALTEHAAFIQQSESARWEQSRLLARLRDPRLPTAGELLRNQRALEWLQSNYSTWLSIITSADNIAYWRQAYAELPAWRRKLSLSGRGKTSSDGFELKGGFSWKWLWILLIIGLARMCTSMNSDQPKPPPAPPQQQQHAQQPMRAGDFLRRGNAQLERNEFAHAIDSYDQVIHMAPNNFMAYIGRGTAYLGLGDDQQAEADFNQSAELESDNHALESARGKLADYRNQPEKAIKYYTAAMEKVPNPSLLWLRASAYQKTGDYVHALADINQLIESAPRMPVRYYASRVDLLLQLRRPADADAAAKAALAKYPADSEAYLLVSEQYRKHGHIQKADVMLERGIRMAPGEQLLLARADLRAASDVPGRRADLARAASIAPASFRVAQRRVDLEIAAGNPAAADQIVAQALGGVPKDNKYWSLLLATQGVIASKRGRQAVAEQHFSDALKAAHTPWEMNEICWLMAERNASLPTALFICDAALERQPDNRAAHDSRGLVLLRLGRYHEALTAYEAALKGRPNFAQSLLGRGLARQHLGDQAGGDADINAALSIQPSLRKDYTSYGFKL